MQVKKVVALHTKQAFDVSFSLSINQKRKSSLEGGPRAKRAHDSSAPSIALDSISPVPKPHWHDVGKGLMISLGPPVPLLVRSQELAVKMAWSLVLDLDIDRCSKHKTKALGDLGLSDMVKVSNCSL